MIEFISNWAEQLVLAVIIATILEMLLPQNKSKKYVKIIIGIYILFCIISPFVTESNSFSLEDIDLSDYYMEENEKVNQESMDKRLQELYIEELEQNIIKTAEENGYKVIKCKVDAILDSNDENAGINKIYLEVSKNKDISKIENVEIDIDTSKENKTKIDENREISENEETEELTKMLSKYYEIEEKKISIIVK